MDLQKIINLINAVSIPDTATITQLKHEEDDEYYQVWKIDANGVEYILKEAKESEREIYQTYLKNLQESAPILYEAFTVDGKTYLLLEYIDGESLCKANRTKLIHALDALISLQQKTWEDHPFDKWENSFEKSLIQRKNRGEYLNDSLLEEAYERFLKVFQLVPKALCHDDLLPFNIISGGNKAFLIDWECGGILPYPTSFARLIAHTEEKEDALFYMTKADKRFAIDYYYDRLLKEKGISYSDWLTTLDYFLFYEYCEWVFVGNKYNSTHSEYYKKYLPLAKEQATVIIKSENMHNTD